MGSIHGHKKRIREHLDELQDAVNIGIEKRPATVGFHTAACAAEMLELYLHCAKLVSSGKQVNHAWFKRPKERQKIEPLIERKLPVSFPDKERIYELMYEIEENRDTLIYGKSIRQQIEATYSSFQKLREALGKKIEEKGEHLE